MIYNLILLAQLVAPVELCPEHNDRFRYDWATQQYVWERIIKNCVEEKKPEVEKKPENIKIPLPVDAFRV